MEARQRIIRTLGIAAKVLVSGGLIWLALARTDVAAVVANLGDLPAETIVVSLGLMMVMALIATLRWSILSGAIGLALPFGRACRYLFIGMFFNQTLPSSLGGDAFRVLLLRNEGLAWTEGLANVLLDRFVGLVALAAVSLLGLPVLLSLDVSPTAAVVVATLGGGALAALVGLYWLGGRPPFRRERHFVWLIRRLATGLRAVAAEWGTAVTIVLLSLAVHLAVVVTSMVLLAGMGHPVTFGLLLAIVPAVMLIAVVPISIAGWGVREGAMIVGLGFVGVPQVDALSLSLMLGICLFVIGLPGAALWLIRSHA
jgi:uncharacterized membrane protein YbhN (UPF0104 family)